MIGRLASNNHNHKPDVSQINADLVSWHSKLEAAAQCNYYQGLDLAAIVLEMRGIKSTQGRRYQQAAEEISNCFVKQ